MKRALAGLDRAANRLEEIGLVPQADEIDAAGETIEELRETLAVL